ncbi:AAA-like domain-containing protein [Planktothrix agardhii]|uniref:AAA-like domain-containing protein n=1 Tax=Planktothrix agardhii TaxID=1160 RepID=UPI000406522C|nr:AAA-like domain-containing protein [Planktothrix agardhii]
MLKKEPLQIFNELPEKRKELFLLTCQGKTDAEIAEAMEIDTKTVRKQRSILGVDFDTPTNHNERRPNLKKDLLKIGEQLGLVPSDFYIERPPIELNCNKEILKLGALIRIKAPRKMGKTLLLNRLLNYAEQQNHETVILNFEEVDSEILSQYKNLLQWFCSALSDLLEVENNVSELWKDIYGSNKNTTNYLEKYLLAGRTQPLVIVLEKVDIVFEQGDYNEDFCKMLRSWYDTAKRNERRSAVWKNLRLIIVHSTEVYASLDINSSPLSGAGLTVSLPDFTLKQVQALAQDYRLTNLDSSDFDQLMLMFGGYPYLVQSTFEYLKNQEFSLNKLVEIAPTEQSPFINDLRELLGILQKSPELAQSYRDVVTQNKPVRLSTNQTFKLESLGLVKVENDECKPRCDLYRQYFSGRL